MPIQEFLSLTHMDMDHVVVELRISSKIVQKRPTFFFFFDVISAISIWAYLLQLLACHSLTCTCTETSFCSHEFFFSEPHEGGTGFRN